MATTPKPTHPPYPPAYAYPRCCGQPTRLSPFGWHCGQCGTYHEFRDPAARNWNQIRLAHEAPAQAALASTGQPVPIEEA